MIPKSIEKLESDNDNFKQSNGSDDCMVSKASTEIMLDRFCSGREIDFPFTK